MTYRKWFVFGGVFALVGAVVAGVGIFSGNFSPRGYVADRYTRSTSHDIGSDARAYTSKESPSNVAQQITKEWKPADQVVDGSGVYLRYADDAVVVLPLAVGSLILVEKISTAYPRYHGTVGSGWSTSRGSIVRGGGPGTGK